MSGRKDLKPKCYKYPSLKEWRINGPEGPYHRLDGPAIEWAYGTKEWIQNGQRHRLDGPAIEWANGTKEWYQNGQCHRLDGPAIERVDGDKEYWIRGTDLNEKEIETFNYLQTCELKELPLHIGTIFDELIEKRLRNES
jgi:hypothetical protein